MQWLPSGVRSSIAEAEAEAAVRIEGQFRQRAAAVAADRLHWIDCTRGVDSAVAEYARLYDITVLAADQPETEAHLLLHPDRVALMSGRPTLVFPATFAAKEINEHAILAWDGGRSAARALTDAMQVLETKRLVTILTIGDSARRSALPGIDIETVLARHGVPTETVALARDGHSIGRQILDFCAASQAGLLVMGAYEHSKFREDLLGGVTHTVTREADLPILISH
jgi:nucleotide-binding universal stress UspA family protein